MKKLFLLTVIGINSLGLSAQNKVADKNKTVVEKMLQNRPKTYAEEVIVVKIPIDSSFVNVVDNKIYRGKSLAFDLIPKDQLELVTTVRDPESTTGIRYIFIYKRKN